MPEVISLHGTWEEMGRQYGKLAGAHLLHVHDFMTDLIRGDSLKMKSVTEMAGKLVSVYPHSFLDFFRGAALTSGLSYEDLVMVNAVEYAEAFYCSGIAVWGDYAKGSGLVYGRNYDAISFRPIAEDVIITVFHPSDGSIPTATIGYAGELYAVNAINGAGLFVELNNGMASAGYDIDFKRMAGTANLLQMMFQAENAGYADAFLRTNRSFASFIIGVADSHGARSYEWCAEGTRCPDSATPDGLMVMTNHYVDPGWTFPVPSDELSWNSITRRNNLIALADSCRGDIDAEKMCRIISTPIGEGGPWHPYTRYQMVFEPATMMLRMRVENAADWDVLDMAKYLRQEGQRL